MKPLFATLILSAALAGFLWWQQRGAIASLRHDLSAALAPAGAQTPAVPSAKAKPARPSPNTLRHPDGSEVVTSRSGFRALLEAMDYFRRLSRSDVEALLAAGIEDGDDIFGSYTGMALARLAEFDPVAAVRQAGALARTKNDSTAFSIIMHDWLIRDRAAALKWFHAQPDTNAKAGFMGVAGMVLAASDPVLLQQLSGSFEDPDVHADALKNSLTTLALTDPDAALSRMQELPDDESRLELLRQLAMTYGAKKPRELLEAILPLSQPKTERPECGMLLNEFAAGDPRAALDWIVQRPELEREVLMTNTGPAALSKLGTLETPAILAAAKGLPAAEQDWLLAAHYAGRPLDDPAALLAETRAAIQDQGQRDEAVRSLIMRAAHGGQAAALEPWIATLPAADQASVRKLISGAKEAK